MSSQSSPLESLRREAKAKFKSDEIFFLDHPTYPELGFHVQLKEYSDAEHQLWASINGQDLGAHILSAINGINALLTKWSNTQEETPLNLDLSDWLAARMATHVNYANEPDFGLATSALGQQPFQVSGEKCAHDLSDTERTQLYHKLRLFEQNNDLLQQSLIRYSCLYLQQLRSLLELYPLFIFLYQLKFHERYLNYNHHLLAKISPQSQQLIASFCKNLRAREEIFRRFGVAAALGETLSQFADPSFTCGLAFLGVQNSISALLKIGRASCRERV